MNLHQRIKTMTCAPLPQGSKTRSVDRGFAIGLMVVTVILFVAGCHRDPGELAEKKYARAQEYLKNNKTEEAIIELGRAAQLNPAMTKAHRELARLYIQRRENGDAYRELSTTITENPQDREAYTMMGDLLVETQNFSQAKEVASKALGKWPEDINAKLIMAESLIGLKDWKPARKLVDGILQKDTKNIRAQFDLAALDLHDKKWTAAEENLRSIWNRDPNAFGAPSMLSRLLEFRGDKKGAESILKQLVASHATSIDPMYLLAGFYVRQRQLDKAQDIFQRIQTQGNADPQHRGALGIFYAASGRLDAAESEFQRIRVSYPEDSLNAKRLAEVEIALNRREQARQILNDLLKNHPKDWEALLQLGRLDVDDGNMDQAERNLNQAKAIRPDFPLVHFQLARMYLSEGKTKLAEDALRQSLKQAPGFTAATVILAELDLRSGHAQRAMQDLDEALKQNPGSVAPNLLVSQAYAAQGNYFLAEKKLNQLLDRPASPTDKAMILQTLASIKFQQGDYAEAQYLVTKSLNMGLLTREGLKVLGLSYLQQKQAERGLQAIGTYLHKADRWAAGQDVLGELAAQAGMLDLAENAYEKELQLDPKSISALFGLAAIQESRGRYGQAQQLYERVVSAEPRNALAHARLGGLAQLRQDWPSAISEYKKTVELDSSAALVKSNLAWLYSEHGGDIEGALRLAQEARTLVPDDPRVADTLAWIYLKSDQPSSALPLLRVCVSRASGNAVYHYHLGATYLKLGRAQEAKRELESALRLQNSFDGAAEAKRLLDSIPVTAKK